MKKVIAGGAAMLLMLSGTAIAAKPAKPVSKSVPKPVKKSKAPSTTTSTTISRTPEQEQNLASRLEQDAIIDDLDQSMLPFRKGASPINNVPAAADGYPCMLGYAIMVSKTGQKYRVTNPLAVSLLRDNGEVNYDIKMFHYFDQGAATPNRFGSFGEGGVRCPQSKPALGIL
jgi:hypothetical protein